MFLSKQFLKFIITGGTAAVVNFISRIIINQFFSFETSVILAYLLGMMTAFLLARLYVFEKSNQSIFKEAYYFSLVNIFAILQTFVISTLLARKVFPYLNFKFYPFDIAHIIGIVFPVFTSFIGHKKLSFKNSNPGSLR